MTTFTESQCCNMTGAELLQYADHAEVKDEIVRRVVLSRIDVDYSHHTPQLYDALKGLLRVVDDSVGVFGYETYELDDTRSWDEFPPVAIAKMACDDYERIV